MLAFKVIHISKSDPDGLHSSSGTDHIDYKDMFSKYVNGYQSFRKVDAVVWRYHSKWHSKSSENFLLLQEVDLIQIKTHLDFTWDVCFLFHFIFILILFFLYIILGFILTSILHYQENDRVLLLDT